MRGRVVKSSLRGGSLGCLGAVMACCLGDPASAQPIEGPAAEAASEAVVTPAEVTGDGLLELNLPPNVELKVLIDYVSQRLGVNILYDEQVANKRVMVKSPTKVPVESLMGILESALYMKGLLLQDAEQPGWKRIVPLQVLTTLSPSMSDQDAIPTDRAMEIQTRVVALEHVQPAMVEMAIRPFLSQPGGNTMVVAHPGQRLIIVTDFAANMARIGELIRLMDRPAGQVRTELVPVTNQNAAVLAPRLAQAMLAQARILDPAGGGGAIDMEVVPDERTNQLIIVGRPDRVAAAAALAAELDRPLAVSTRSYWFSIVAPDRVQQLVRSLLDPQNVDRLFRSTIDKESGLLMVTTTQEIHEQIEALRQVLDVAAPPEQSPIRLYKLINADAADVLATLSAIVGGKELDSANVAAAPDVPHAPNGPDALPDAMMNHARPDVMPATMDRDTDRARDDSTLRAVHSDDATVTLDKNTNSIIVIAPPAVQKVYEQLIHMLDQRRPQVLIEATIVTIDTTDDFSLGVELAREGSVTIGGKTASTLFFSQFGLSTLDPKTHRLELEPGAGFNGVLLSTDLADVVVRALKTHGRSSVMSTPKLLVNDNATGKIDSINEAPFASINSSNTVATTSFGGFISAGTQISVTPHIAEGDHLRLEFEVALNSFTGDSANGLPPPRQTNSIVSEVTIPDGHTIVVGGLNRMDHSFSKQAIPFLGNIPVLEYLFSSRTQGSRSATLFVFIRPVILRDDRFKDLKYLSQKDRASAQIPDAGAAPQSKPMLVR